MGTVLLVKTGSGFLVLDYGTGFTKADRSRVLGECRKNLEKLKAGTS